MNRKLTFIAMYRALDCLYEEAPCEEMRDYLSDANPYIFKDRESADPAIGAEFADLWTKLHYPEDVSANEAYAFVKEYLRSSTAFATAFEDISFAEWCDLCDIISDEEIQQE